MRQDGCLGDMSEIAGVGVHALEQYTFDDISCSGIAPLWRYWHGTK